MFLPMNWADRFSCHRPGGVCHDAHGQAVRVSVARDERLVLVIRPANRPSRRRGGDQAFFYVAMVVIPIYVYAFGLCVVNDKFFATGAAFSIVLMILLLFGYYLRPETPHGVKGSLHQALCIGHY